VSESTHLTPQPAKASVLRILLKAFLLFVAFNVVFALLSPMPLINSLTIYNGLVPGRTRLPFGEDASAYNLSLNSLEAMFTSHEVTQPKHDDEYRVFVIGDSSVWGILLKPDETLASELKIVLDDGRTLQAYNLGHPVLSLTKDLLILDYAMRYEPDMIIWLTTLRSFPRDKQFSAALVQNNAPHVRRLFQDLELDYDLADPQLNDPTFFDRTIIGQRRPLADWLRLQLYGVMWASTGIDQTYPDEIDLRTGDFDTNIAWDEITEPRQLTDADLAFDVLEAGHRVAGEIPILIINEPIFISKGENSDLRYNLWYPRWAYDSYRQLYQAAAENLNWHFLDLWNSIDSDEFTDSPVHLTPRGTQLLAEQLRDTILTMAHEGIN